jgi:hypothetical protein
MNAEYTTLCFAPLAWKVRKRAYAHAQERLYTRAME